MLVVVAKLSEFVVRIFFKRLIYFLLEGLGLNILLPLRIGWDVLVDVVREDVRLCVFVEAAAAELAHESGERTRNFLNDKEHHENDNAHCIENRVHHLKASTLIAKEQSEDTSDSVCKSCEECHCLVFFLFTLEDVGVGQHVEAHHQVHDLGNFNHATSLVDEIRTMAGRDAIESQQHDLVSPVSREAQNETCKVEGRHGG